VLQRSSVNFSPRGVSFLFGNWYTRLSGCSSDDDRWRARLQIARLLLLLLLSPSFDRNKLQCHCRSTRPTTTVISGCDPSASLHLKWSIFRGVASPTVHVGSTREPSAVNSCCHQASSISVPCSCYYLVGCSISSPPPPHSASLPTRDKASHKTYCEVLCLCGSRCIRRSDDHVLHTQHTPSIRTNEMT